MIKEKLKKSMSNANAKFFNKKNFKKKLYYIKRKSKHLKENLFNILYILTIILKVIQKTIKIFGKI